MVLKEDQIFIKGLKTADIAVIFNEIYWDVKLEYLVCAIKAINHLLVAAIEIFQCFLKRLFANFTDFQA